MTILVTFHIFIQKVLSIPHSFCSNDCIYVCTRMFNEYTLGLTVLERSRGIFLLKMCSLVVESSKGDGS